MMVITTNSSTSVKADRARPRLEKGSQGIGRISFSENGKE